MRAGWSGRACPDEAATPCQSTTELRCVWAVSNDSPLDGGNGTLAPSSPGGVDATTPTLLSASSWLSCPWYAGGAMSVKGCAARAGSAEATFEATLLANLIPDETAEIAMPLAIVPAASAAPSAATRHCI